MMTIERLTAEQAASHAGTWVDGARGWRAPARVVEIAHTYGMPATPGDAEILAHYQQGDGEPLTLPTGETLDAGEIGNAVSGQGELADQAETWLNDHIAPDGWSFGWIDGDFCLLPTDDH